MVLEFIVCQPDCVHAPFAQPFEHVFWLDG
jgi:hypothetical protein